MVPGSEVAASATTTERQLATFSFSAAVVAAALTTVVEGDFKFFFLCSLPLMCFVTRGWGNDSSLKCKS
jgi:hypothetical protein